MVVEKDLTSARTGNIQIFKFDVGHDLSNKARLRRLIHQIDHHDMYVDANEAFFARLYIEYFNDRTKREYGTAGIKILDAGCAQGRLTIPLAKLGHELVGLDLSAKAIEAAERYAAHGNVNVKWMVGNMQQDLTQFRDGEFDCVICTEALHQMADFEDITKSLSCLVKSGGLFFLAMRPIYYYIARLTLRGDLAQAAALSQSQEGLVDEGQRNCQNVPQLEQLLGANKFKNIEARAVGVVAGLPWDPQGTIVAPSMLSAENQDHLFEIEKVVSERFVESGRFILISGVKE